MKLLWSKDKKSIILVAETKGEVAFADIFVADLMAHKYATTATTAKYTIVPEEEEENMKSK